jgi:hypothetical protein
VSFVGDSVPLDNFLLSFAVVDDPRTLTPNSGLSGYARPS